MRKSYSKIKHISEANQLLERRVLSERKNRMFEPMSLNEQDDVTTPDSNTGKVDFTKFTIEGMPLEGQPTGEGWPYLQVKMFSDLSKGPQLTGDKTVGRWVKDTKTFQPNKLGKSKGFTEMQEKLPENCYTTMGEYVNFE